MDNDFTHYRLKRGYSLKTIRSQDSYIHRFKVWLTANQINTSAISHQTLLDYLFQLKEKGITPQSIRNHLQTIRVYLDYQVGAGILPANLAGLIKLRSTSRRPLPQGLPEETLMETYQWFAAIEPMNESRWLQHRRDTVVLGLLLFQGLDSGDIDRLMVSNINLKQGTVYVPSSRTSAARTLKLESLQILSLQEYLINKDASDKLFTKSKIQDMVSGIVKKIKNRYPEVVDPRHIRSSVVQNWLKKHHIRQVQYMAGHRSITSTERYQKEDLYDLSQQISKYHPMK